jgi:hypothetical protein
MNHEQLKTQKTTRTSENKDVVSAAGAVPSRSFGDEIQNLPLPLIVLIPHLLPKRSFGHSQLQLGAQCGEEGDEYDIGLFEIENPVGEGGRA